MLSLFVYISSLMSHRVRMSNILFSMWWKPYRILHPVYVTYTALHTRTRCTGNRNMTTFFIKRRCCPLHWNPQYDGALNWAKAGGCPMHWDSLRYTFLLIYYQSYVGSITNTTATVEIIIKMNTIYIYFNWISSILSMIPPCICFIFSPIKL